MRWEKVENRDLADQGEQAEREKRGEVGEYFVITKTYKATFIIKINLFSND